MSRLFRGVRTIAGLPHFTLYDLRHTFATQLLTEGADLMYVAHQLGHSKPTTTLAYYAHWIPRGDKKHLDRMVGLGLPSGAHFPPALPQEPRQDLQVLENTGEPSGTRTRDPLIKSQVLYRLS